MINAFLQRPAADFARDPQFGRFLRALERVTHIPRKEAAEPAFAGSDGTVQAVLDDLLRIYPQDVDLGVILDDVRRVGIENEEAKIDRMQAELKSLRSIRQEWHTFMDGRSPL